MWHQDPCMLLQASLPSIFRAQIFFYGAHPTSWEPSPVLLKEAALEFVLSEISSCMEQGCLSRAVITDKSAHANTDGSDAI